MSNFLLNKTLREVSSKVKSGLSSYYLQDGGFEVSLINIRDIQDGEVVPNSVEKVRVRESDTIEKSRIEYGDIIITTKGTFKAALAGKTVEGFAISSNLIALTLNSMVDPRMVVAYLNSPMGQKELQARAGGSTLKALNRKSLLEVEIPLPPIEKQKLLVDYLLLSQQHDHLVIEEQETRKKLTNSILQNCMGGTGWKN